MACFPTASSKVMLSDLWIFAQSDRWNVVSQCCFNRISVITGEVHNVFTQLRPFDSLSLWILSTSVFLLDTSGSFLINVYEVETFVVWVRNIFQVWCFAFQWACFFKWLLSCTKVFYFYVVTLKKRFFFIAAQKTIWIGEKEFGPDLERSLNVLLSAKGKGANKHPPFCVRKKRKWESMTYLLLFS